MLVAAATSAPQRAVGPGPSLKLTCQAPSYPPSYPPWPVADRSDDQPSPRRLPINAAITARIKTGHEDLPLSTGFGSRSAGCGFETAHRKRELSGEQGVHLHPSQRPLTGISAGQGPSFGSGDRI
jgi:hypothetical protein